MTGLLLGLDLIFISQFPPAINTFPGETILILIGIISEAIDLEKASTAPPTEANAI